MRQGDALLLPLDAFLPPLSRPLKVRGGIIAQANRDLGGFCSSQGIFLPQMIQGLRKGTEGLGGVPSPRGRKARPNTRIAKINLQLIFFPQPADPWTQVTGRSPGWVFRLGLHEPCLNT